MCTLVNEMPAFGIITDNHWHLGAKTLSRDDGWHGHCGNGSVTHYLWPFMQSNGDGQHCFLMTNGSHSRSSSELTVHVERKNFKVSKKRGYRIQSALQVAQTYKSHDELTLLAQLTLQKGPARDTRGGPDSFYGTASVGGD